MIDLEKFKESCNKKRCLRQIMYNTKTCITIHKQEDCYKKYLNKQEKDKEKRQKDYAIKQDEINEYKRKKEAGEKIEYKDPDPKWTALLKELWVRDQARCRFFSIMTEEEKKLIRPHLWGDFKKLDGAHILSRSTSPKNKYNADNVVLLYRYLHKSLDEVFDPFTQKSITKEEVEKTWIRIIGQELWDKLQEDK